MRIESTSFMNSMFTAQQHTDAEITSFVLTHTQGTNTTRWSAFLLHETRQFFIKAPLSLPVNKESLVTVLAFAEGLGVSDALICVQKDCANCDKLVAELAAMDFKILSARSQPMSEFVVLCFDF